MEVTGTNFLEGASVQLFKTSSPDLDAIFVSVKSSTEIICDFNVHGLGLDTWGVRVINPDGQIGEINSITLIEPTTGDWYLEVDGEHLDLFIDDNGTDAPPSNPGDSNDPGGINNPWKTIYYALAHIGTINGGTIKLHVAAGTYDTALGEVFPLPMRNGVSLEGGWSDDFSVKDIDLYVTTVYGNGTENGFRFYKINDITIDGLGITNSYSGIYLSSSTNNTITNCSIYDNTSHGIRFGYPTSLNNISNSLIYFNKGNGVHGGYGNTVENAVIYGNAQGVHSSRNTGNSTTVKNSIIAANNGCGLVDDPWGNIYQDYNDVYGNGGDYCIKRAPGENSISELPGFVDPMNGDFRLYSDSPCIDIADSTLVSCGAEDPDMGVYPCGTVANGLVKPVASTVYIVDPVNGPYYTIQEAVDEAIAGATILIEPGTYDPILISNVGTVLSPVTLRANGDVTVNGIMLNGASGVIIDGFTVTGANNGISMYKSFAITLQNCQIHDNTGHGISILYAYADNNIINCDVHDNGGSGLYLASARRTDVRESQFHHNTAHGIWFGYSASLNNIRTSLIYFNKGNGVHGGYGNTVENAVIYGNYQGVHSSRNTGNSTTVKNSIIAANSNCGMSDDDWGNIYQDYNDVYGNGGDYCIKRAPGDNSISKLPGFVDPMNGDFRLYSDSPCIDIADPTLVSCGAEDPDMGAYPCGTIENGEVVSINQPPTAEAGGPYQVNEGEPIILDASGSNDPDDSIVSYEWDLDNDREYDDAIGPNPEVIFGEDGFCGVSFPIGLKVTDDFGAEDTASTTVAVYNVPPKVDPPIFTPTDLVAVGTPIIANADFTDDGVLDTHTAEWDWDDGTKSAGTVVESNGSVSGEHTYTTPGVYTVKLTVEDDDHVECGNGKGSSEYQYVVVYDPDGGFVTGGGWINSPAGAYTGDSMLTGKANFGFVSKYKKGADTPTGQTQFQFKVAGMKFHSSAYQWLVVAGKRAQYKGTGTINGEGAYKFLLTAIDADVNDSDNFTVDSFRIKIWTEGEDNSENIVYDNGLGEDDLDDNATIEIGRGSIVIHK